MIHVPALIALLLSPVDVPHLDWSSLFARVTVSGAEFSAQAKSLDGKRVVIRGCALQAPRPDGGVYITRFPEGRLHPDDGETLPWDAAAVFWRKGIEIPTPVPARPSVEGTLRLGNRRVGGETVVFVLEDAVPFVPAPGAAP